MCDYCETENLMKNVKFLVDSELDMGIFPNVDLCVSIYGGEENGYGLQTVIVDGRDLFVKNIPINFCPICGRKLKARKINNEDDSKKTLIIKDLITLQNDFNNQISSYIDKCADNISNDKEMTYS